MGAIREPKPVMLFCAISGIDQPAIDWASKNLSRKYGAVRLAGKPFDFGAYTSFYRGQMGERIVKQFVAFDQLVDPADLVPAKIFANQLESAYCGERSGAGVARPINIDPGYVTEAKLVLATTKDRDHRIYLARGILAEVTLYYQRDHWQSCRWTYPDYQTPECFEFLDQCRDFLRKQLRG